MKPVLPLGRQPPAPRRRGDWLAIAALLAAELMIGVALYRLQRAGVMSQETFLGAVVFVTASASGILITEMARRPHRDIAPRFKEIPPPPDIYMISASGWNWIINAPAAARENKPNGLRRGPVRRPHRTAVLKGPWKEPKMTILLGQIAPDFEQDSTHGRIRFHEWQGDSWVLLFSHPKNFTPVCTTELGEVAKLRREWDTRKVKPIGLSVDAVEAHHKWEVDIEETQGAKLDFPMIADPDGKVSTLYDMIHPESDPAVTVRSVFIIDPAHKVRMILTYPPSTGRNFAEILRVIDSIQLTDARSIATPVNWEPGEPVVISPKMSEEEASRQFPQGYKTLKPYLRIVDL